MATSAAAMQPPPLLLTAACQVGRRASGAESVATSLWARRLEQLLYTFDMAITWRWEAARATVTHGQGQAPDGCNIVLVRRSIQG